VTQRTRELGIRLALGARPRALLGLVVAQSLRPVVAGILAGLALSLAATRALASLLYAVSATDPLTFVVVPPVLLVAAAAAAGIAALRATRVDPMTALRAE
jgi:putative ABC transport system permease protein